MVFRLIGQVRTPDAMRRCALRGLAHRRVWGLAAHSWRHAPAQGLRVCAAPLRSATLRFVLRRDRGTGARPLGW